MTAKMQREGGGLWFQLSIPSPLFSTPRWICPAGRPRELGMDLGSSTLVPLGGRWSLQLLPS